MFDGGNVRRVHSIEVERRFGFVDVVDDFDFQRIIGFEIFSINGNFHAANERRLKIDAGLHQRTFRFGRVKNDFRHSRTNQRDESARRKPPFVQLGNRGEVTCARIDISSSIPGATDRNRVLEKRFYLEESVADDHRSASHDDCSARR